MRKKVKKFPSQYTLKCTLTKPKNQIKISLHTTNKGFEMNEEMIQFLEKSPELDVQVQTI